MTQTKCINCKHVLYDRITLSGMELDFYPQKYCGVQNFAYCDKVNDGNCLFFEKRSIIPDIILITIVALVPISLILALFNYL